MRLLRNMGIQPHKRVCAMRTLGQLKLPFPQRCKRPVLVRLASKPKCQYSYCGISGVSSSSKRSVDWSKYPHLLAVGTLSTARVVQGERVGPYHCNNLGSVNIRMFTVCPVERKGGGGEFVLPKWS